MNMQWTPLGDGLALQAMKRYGRTEDEDIKRPVVALQPASDFRRRFEVMELLGKGRYGVVHRVREITTGRQFAAKFVRCRDPKDHDKVRNEIQILNQLRHPRILQLYAAFECPREVIMVTEYLPGGELTERIGSDDYILNERDCMLFIRQICEALRYMHNNNVVHMDLKPENVMCHARNSHQITLIDFGLARTLQPDIPVHMLFGTPEFVPPEAICREPIGLESDMWALGVICYILLSGLSPFMGENDAETFANIIQVDYDLQDEAFDAVSEDAKDFISNLLVKKKEDRMTAKECLSHRWLALRDENKFCFK